MSGEPRPDPSNWSCPVDTAPAESVQVAHGGGGRMSQRLMESVFLPALRNPAQTDNTLLCKLRVTGN